MDKLVIDSITKNYKKLCALNNVSLTIEPGIFGLLGPNGAGKTTLMRIIATLIESSSGKIHYGDIDFKDANKVRSIIGYLPQKFSLYKHIRVEEALKHIALLKDIKDMKEVDLVLDKVNLTEHKNKKIKELSGGMVRRLGIAQAILGKPKIIIIDEPTAGLDPEERIRFRKILRNLEKESIIIVSTHIVDDVETICSKAAILNKGSLLCYDTVDSIRAIVKGKIFEIPVSEDEYYNIIDTPSVVSSTKIENGYKVRLISEKKPEKGIEVSPTLEDSYMYLVKSSEKSHD